MSSSSLYGNTGNVTVSAKNLTTLYNAVGGNVVTANVPDRDFTTLYTNQAEINPTRSYGNSNVEAFLNAGTDGANTVQNITANGNITANSITISGISNFGNVGNVHITGGNTGYVLTTDGTGNLAWLSPETGNSSPYIHFDVTTTANNQQFSNDGLEIYGTSYDFSLFKNGVNIEPFYYEKAGLTTVQVNILLNAGDTVDILPSSSGGGSGGLPAGIPTSIQYNGNYTFAGDTDFTYDSTTTLMSVVNANISGNLTVGQIITPDAANLTIGGGSANYILATDGAGNVSWQAQAGANGFPSGSTGEIQYNSGSNSFASSTDLTYNSITGHLTAPRFVGVGDLLDLINGANVTGTVPNAAFSLDGNRAELSNIANISIVSYSVTGSNVVGSVSSAVSAGVVTTAAQPSITSLGTLTGLTSVGVVNLSSASNVSLGSVSNVHLSGGSANYILQTDGSGTLSWVSPLSANASPGGSNTSVQFNDNGVWGGDANLTFDKVTNVLAVPTVSTRNIANVLTASEYVVFTTFVSGSLTFDTLASSIVQATTNTASNFVINFTNLSLNIGDCRTFAYINKNAGGTTYYCTGVQIAGVSQSVNWLGGAGPTLGGTNDIYNITVIKTGSSSYSIFASVGSY